MDEKEFSKNLRKDARERKKMLNETLNNMDEYSNIINMKDKTIEQYKIDAIKYKTTVKELNEYIVIYKNKIDELNQNNEKDNNELIRLRKKVLNDKTEISKLKSIIELLIKEYGIDNISLISKLEKDKLQKLVED